MRALYFLSEALLVLFCSLFLLRFYMQCCRVSFMSDLGRFVHVLTEWALAPLRRLLPRWRSIEWSGVLLVWLANVVFAWLWLPIQGSGVWPALLGHGLVKTLYYFLQLLSVVLLGFVITSWIRSYSHGYLALREALLRMAQPLLAPIQRMLPPIANIDLSPLVAILLLQALKMLLPG